MADPTLEAYRHYLISLRRYRPHTLTELGRKGHQRQRQHRAQCLLAGFFRDHVVADIRFRKARRKSRPSISVRFSHCSTNPTARCGRAPWRRSIKVCLSRAKVLTFIYDTLIQDQLTMDRLRSYPDPMAQRHLFNEIDGAAVKTMMAVVEENYGLAQDYFRLKAKLLKLPRLALYDQYAPVGKEVKPFPYHQARQVILAAFDAFDPKFRQIAAEFLIKVDRCRDSQRQTRRRLLRLAFAAVTSVHSVQLR